MLYLVLPKTADTLKNTLEASGWAGIDRWIADGGVRNPVGQARARTRLGRLDEAVATLRGEYERKSPRLIGTIKAEPMFDPLRDRPDFKQLLEDMGLAD